MRLDLHDDKWSRSGGRGQFVLRLDRLPIGDTFRVGAQDRLNAEHRGRRFRGKSRGAVRSAIGWKAKLFVLVRRRFECRWKPMIESYHNRCKRSLCRSTEILQEQQTQMRGKRLKLEGGGRFLVPASSLSFAQALQ